MTHLPPESLLVFTVDQQQFALGVAAVEKVVEAVELLPLPGAPRAVRGTVNVHGALLPVFDVRRRLAISPREVRVSDYLIIAVTAARRIALLVDEVHEVMPRPRQHFTGDVAADRFLEGAVRLPGGLVLIEDLERFIGMPGEESLRNAWLHEFI